jgi:CubicO group peptidase (beta-lactamase class C family)
MVFSLILVFSGCNEEETQPRSSFRNLEEEVNHIADQYVKVGLNIGIIDNHQKRQVFSYGSKSMEVDDPPDANTAFDIGSMTKTFTATLMADMYLTGNFTDDTVSHYLPADQVTLPTWNGKEITFVEVATHTSGLPRTPHEYGSSFPRPPGFDEKNPYSVYTTEDVYDYLTHYCQLKFEPGTWWEYSNTGYGLLGHIVGLVDHSSYETVLKRDIFQVLGMNNSSLFLTVEQEQNFAQGYDTGLKETSFYVANDIFQGAGFIKSSLNDLFIYLEANMGLINTTLRDAMDLAHEPQVHQGSMGDQGLAWYILELDDGQTVIYTGGDTNGHSAYLGFNKSTSTGTIVLSNYAMHGSQLTMGAEILQAIIKY